MQLAMSDDCHSVNTQIMANFKLQQMSVHVELGRDVSGGFRESVRVLRVMGDYNSIMEIVRISQNEIFYLKSDGIWSRSCQGS